MRSRQMEEARLQVLPFGLQSRWEWKVSRQLSSGPRSAIYTPRGARNERLIYTLLAPECSRALLLGLHF